MKKIWINGANGQIGKTICELADKLEYEIFKTDQDEVDITNLDEVINFGVMARPELIINCAGITDVKYCEEHEKEAYKVNAIGARNLAIVSKQLDAAMLQISTDDVFDGLSDAPYDEFAQPSPCSIYGKSKLAGEQYVKEFVLKHFIVRSNWVYGTGVNFVTSLLEKAKEQSSIEIYANQYGSPTSAKELAKFLLHLIETKEYGTYHATCKGVVSRYAFAKEIIACAGLSNKIKPMSSFELEEQEVRPDYAVLRNLLLEISFDYELLDWKQALEEFMKEN